jgi:nitrate reductase NapE component
MAEAAPRLIDQSARVQEEQAPAPCETSGMERGTVLMIVVLVVLPIAAVLFAGAFGLLEELGRGGLSIDDRPHAPAPLPATPAARMERETEIRQLVQARHDRQAARGEAPLDVEAEVSRLLALGSEEVAEEDRADTALREEVRQLVIARNDRRVARGERPLDVEMEIERQLRDLT